MADTAEVLLKPRAFGAGFFFWVCYEVLPCCLAAMTSWQNEGVADEAAFFETARLWRGVFLLAGGFLGASLWAGVNSMHFVDVADVAGLHFTHENGMTGERWLAETVGSGVGVLDFDGDGRLDVWLVQNGLFDRSDNTRTNGGGMPRDRLFRNVSANGELRFDDVTGRSGVNATGYGMGIATGDIDNDGDADVFLANYGFNQLFENLGDGRFRDITAASGLGGDSEWSVSATFADFDADGRLDLYVGNYLDFTLANHRDCRDLASRATYCAPENYASVKDRLYRNVTGARDGARFKDVSVSSGIASAFGPALGVVSQDFDGDDDVDFYVANDGAANLLWLNQGGGRFANEAELAFVAFNSNGAAEAGMGLDAEDYDGDCDVDLFVTHLTTETNTLYVNNGGWFSDATNAAGLAASSGPYTGFGTGWFDADNDGDLDLFSANGAVFPIAAQREAGVAYPLRQRNQLWSNDGHGRYTEQAGGPAFDLVEVSRGAAFADLDNDGDVDIVVANNSGPARLYRNDTTAATWLGVELRDADGVLATGATVWLDTESCGARRIATDGSYASAGDSRVVFGLGSESEPRFVRVRWPDGSTGRFGPLAPNSYHRLQQTPP